MNRTTRTAHYTLCINCGSSSLKFSLYGTNTCALQFSGEISPIGQENSALVISDACGRLLEKRQSYYADLAAAVSELIAWLKTQEGHYPLFAIAHRLVQGGPAHRQPELIRPELLDDLQQYIYLAPNHLPDELATIKTFGTAFPEARQVACFDTAFHRDMPAVAKNYPFPAKFQKKGLFKYGFHGLSYAYVLQELAVHDAQATGQKLIIAHLGNGASMAAIANGLSMDTTMGVSPIGGLVMGTRSGDLDPGVLLFLLKQYRMSPEALEDLLSKHSGLKGIAGSSDVQELIKNEAGDPGAEAALRLFCYSAKKHIGSLAAALEGLDTLVFTGGIGEHSAVIRERVCQGLDFLGITLDKERNIKNELTISDDKSRVRVRVIKTNEELMMARLVQTVLTATKH